jgi:ferritin-like metal-binding protein YciE
MELNSLRELFVHELKDVYSAEKQITQALPKMIKGAGNTKLASALKDHLSTTEGQVERLDRIFASLGESARSNKKCHGMEGLLEEGAELLKEKGEAEVLDAGIIAAAQKVEHYEIAAYGTLITWAGILGEQEAQSLLQETLGEEKEADQLLSQIAETTVNAGALAQSTR